MPKARKGAGEAAFTCHDAREGIADAHALLWILLPLERKGDIRVRPFSQSSGQGFADFCQCPLILIEDFLIALKGVLS